MNVPKGDLAKRARRASMWSGVDGVVRGLVGFGITIVLARLVSPAEFGVIAMILVFNAVATVLVDFGIGTALIQRRDTSHVEESTAFYFNVGMSLLLALLLGFSAPSIAAFFGEPELIGIARVMAANVVIGALGAIHTTILIKALDFRPLTVIGIWSSLLSGALAAFLAWKGFGVWALAWQVIAQTTISTAMLWWLHPWRPLRTFHRQALRMLVDLGGHVMVARLIDAVYTRLYSVFIGKLFNASDLGFYSRAQSTQQLPANLLTRVLNRVALPAFAETAHNPVRLSAALAKSSRLLMFVNFPLMLGVILVANPLVESLFGPRWIPAATLLQILAIGGLLWPLQVLNVSALVAQGHSRLLLRIELLKKSFGVIALFVASNWGLEAIAWSQVITACVAFFINSFYTGRLLDFGGFAQLKAISGIATAALLMAAIVLVVNSMVFLHPLPQLLLLGSVGACAYLIASLLFGELSVSAGREMWRTWWPRAPRNRS